MTKPDDIPQDVWDAASTCLGFYDASPFGGITGQAVAKIARAIMAEREACAVLAETYKSGMTAAIAAAIRNRG